MVKDLTYNEPIGKSHHVVLNWKLNCYTNKVPENRVGKNYCYERGDYNTMRITLESINWQEVLSGKSTQEMWNEIQTTILQAVELSVPVVKPRSSISNFRKKPLWMDSKVMAKLKKKKSAFTRYLETKEGSENSKAS